jgi:hypothetical protein
LYEVLGLISMAPVHLATADQQLASCNYLLKPCLPVAIAAIHSCPFNCLFQRNDITSTRLSYSTPDKQVPVLNVSHLQVTGVISRDHKPCKSRISAYGIRLHVQPPARCHYGQWPSTTKCPDAMLTLYFK